MLRFVSLCKSLPPGDALIAGVSRETIQRNILGTLCELCGIPTPTSKAASFTIFGRTVHLVGAPDESAVRRIKGSTLVMAYLDELSDLPEPFYKMILSRLSVTGAQLIATTNPESPQHWLKKKVIDNPEIEMQVFSFGLDDNPILSEDYKDSLKREYTGVWYNRYIMGEWSRAEGLIFDGFDPDVNVIEHLNRPNGVRIAGLDYGTTNPTACVVANVRPNMYPQIFIEDEYYFDPEVTGYNKTDAELADDIQDFLKLYHIEALYCDPAAASLKLELMRRDVPVVNANNDVLNGIKICNKFLKQLNIMVHKKCKNLTGQMQSYSWDSKMTDKGFDVPIKKDDHCVDAFRYLIASKFPTGELEEFYTAEKLEELYNESMRENYA